jgi:hypothetical protein
MERFAAPANHLPEFSSRPELKKPTDEEDQEARFAVRRAKVEKLNKAKAKKKFKNIKAKELVKEYEEVFSETMAPGRHFKGAEMDIHMRENVTGIGRCATSKRIPLHWKEEADLLVANMLKADIMEKVTTPTDWCSAGKFVLKPNGRDLRLVQYYVALNRNVKRPTEPTNSARDIHKQILPSSKFFVAINLSAGYWQLKLAKSYRDLTTIIMPQGRFCMKRAPMGLSSSGDAFLIQMEEIFGHLPWLLKLIDNLLIQGTSKKQVLRRLKTVLKTCRKHGVTLKGSNIQIGSSVDFAGFRVESGDDGVVIVPDPRKVEGIRNFQSPTCVEELRSFLGLAGTLSAWNLCRRSAKLGERIFPRLYCIIMPQNEPRGRPRQAPSSTNERSVRACL